MSSFADRIKESYKKEAVRQKERMDNPDRADSKKVARGVGVFFILLGLAFTGVNYYLFMEEGQIRKLPLACMIGFLFLGVWLLIFGKLPKGMKR